MSEQQSQYDVTDRLRERVQEHLVALISEQGQRHDRLQPLKDLFRTDLNYDFANDELSRRDWRAQTASYLIEDPLLLASGADGDFPVIYARLTGNQLPVGHERPVMMELLKKQLYGLFVFSDATQSKWHFVNVKEESKNTRRPLFRRITVSSDERLRTAVDRISMLDLSHAPDASRFDIVGLHERAFDVGAVTKAFFNDYRLLFRELQADFTAQTGDDRWAHDYALQFLNRCMFLYFIQRKGWLGGDREFLRTFWHVYLSSDNNDTFHERWLSVLFFQAFNRSFDSSATWFPPAIYEALAHAPYLNGGLFAQNELDTRYSFHVSDYRFSKVFDFLEGYNFTIAEDSPLDQEVAVDPEMIGYVYESLVNVSTEANERSDIGIFYTPRAEIDLMCRLSLVEYLTNRIGVERKNILYDVVFALEPHEKSEADDWARQVGIWDAIGDGLRRIRCLDPACGSGSFLVGMLYVLDDVNSRVNRETYDAGDLYKRKKRLIEESLYGVDVMPWAVQTAELRLWLSLIIDTNMSQEELHNRRDPLLPHLSFKIRCGDSLVQEVAGVNMSHRQITKALPKALDDRIRAFQSDKRDYFHNYAERRPKTKEQLEQEEYELFCAILDERIRVQQDDVNQYTKKLAEFESRAEQQTLIGEHNTAKAVREAEIRRMKKELDEKVRVLHEYQGARDQLKTPRDVPFVWDIAFVEIFHERDGGFDIVIGNPPYVRQERIAATAGALAYGGGTYKAKLAEAVYRAFPTFFHYEEGGTAGRKIDAKSDLYIYFYFQGLSLLKSQGAFCFITSNSWLDVGYGTDLQEFLLRYCRIKLIVDNQAKRSFASAKVNTIITLFSAPAKEPGEAEMDNMARFVSFKIDFEQALNASLFKQIEQTHERSNPDEYRIHPISQRDLLVDGYARRDTTAKEEDEPALKSKQRRKKATTSVIPGVEEQPVYGGNKWGGKYLRAPDIYWAILTKCRDKLVRLGDIAEVRFGIKTGANEFFYLDEAKARQWRIEDEFLRPVIKSPRECKSILIDPAALKTRLFVCHKSKADLKGTAALAYIEWGEKQGYHNIRSVAGRSRWWSLSPDSGNSLFVKEANDTSAVFYNPNKYIADCRLYYADLPIATLLYLNSAIGMLLFEIYNRAGLGEGARSLMVADYKQVPVLGKLDIEEEAIKAALQNVYGLPPRKLTDNKKRAWSNIDAIVFDALELTADEREDVYEAVKDLVNARLNKAESFKERRDLNERVDAVLNTLGIWIGVPDDAIEAVAEAGEPYA
ncbi:MAG TPA: DNA methyltransferase [Ktedonobacteraceae bacterium]|nr:DNA methyltransferase [Ktedonobacteraceae bacterium]